MDIFRKVSRFSRYFLTITVNRSSSGKVIDEKDPNYTKEGDGGYSKVEGSLISKDDQIFKAIGTTGELSSYIGLAREFAIDKQHPYIDKLTRIQTLLVDVVMEINHSQKTEPKRGFTEKNTKEIEEWIEEYSVHLTPKEQFILPGGGKAATSLHIARNICQRAERSVIPLVKQGIVNQEILVYLNRLGDFLLTVSRLAAKTDKRSESVYTPLTSEPSDRRQKPS